MDDLQVKKIPAFTVLKNGSILKKIFLLRKPPQDQQSANQESDEQILLVGRHPHCNITLEHPSISRYHLRIHSNPSSQLLFVIDQSSAHGTWVSGKRIAPGVPVKLQEGDTVRMGGSSRVYELHWVPLNDLDNSFVPGIYAIKEGDEEIKQDEISLSPSDDDLENLKEDPDDLEVEHSSPWKKVNESVAVQAPLVVSETISVNKLENQSDKFEQVEMKDDLVSEALCDAEKDGLNQETERSNESDEGSEYETVHEQKIENISVPMSPFTDDENGVFMPEDNVGCEFEQMKTVDESASFILFEDDLKLELFDQVTRKKDSFQIFSPDISRTEEEVDTMTLIDGNELEIFTPSKENTNPNVSYLKIEDEVDHCTRSKKALNPDQVLFSIDYPQEVIDSSDDENPSNDDSEIQHSEDDNMSGKEDGFSCDVLETEISEGFEQLSGIESQIVSSVPNAVETEKKTWMENEEKERLMIMEGSYNCPQKNITKKRWTMVVDTNSLLQDESLKHLKLLQGLIGTQLFVPKIVMRKLIDIKASSALKWIEECIMNTRWWIHMNDEIVHPLETESEIVETAIHLHRENEDRKIIILSDDLTLKIKAMAQGVMCESAQEFRWSLVNPFSERFMWVGCSAIGPTWSCEDDDVLRQKYQTNASSYRFKGLKLLANFF